jgi:hypothetical protein
MQVYFQSAQQNCDNSLLIIISSQLKDKLVALVDIPDPTQLRYVILTGHTCPMRGVRGVRCFAHNSDVGGVGR